MMTILNTNRWRCSTPRRLVRRRPQRLASRTLAIRATKMLQHIVFGQGREEGGQNNCDHRDAEPVGAVTRSPGAVMSTRL